jgi:hypothetical protein
MTQMKHMQCVLVPVNVTGVTKRDETENSHQYTERDVPEQSRVHDRVDRSLRFGIEDDPGRTGNQIDLQSAQLLVLQRHARDSVANLTYNVNQINV